MTERWFGEGLRFSCQRCGTCCTGEPGYVFVEDREVEAIASFLGRGAFSFRARYTRPAEGRVSLIEEKDGGCVFHSAEGCRIYPVRPRQCRTFPFWLDIVRRRASWAEAARECPGMDRGKLHSADEIERLVDVRIRREG